LEEIYKDEREKQITMHSSRPVGYVSINGTKNNASGSCNSTISIENCENSSESKETVTNNSCSKAHVLQDKTVNIEPKSLNKNSDDCYIDTIKNNKNHTRQITFDNIGVVFGS
jgi:hypothetical protein